MEDVVEGAGSDKGSAAPRRPAPRTRFVPAAAHDRGTIHLFLRVDSSLARTRGTGLDGIAAVLGTVVDWPTDDDGIAAVAR
jgi:hypothetical protein